MELYYVPFCPMKPLVSVIIASKNARDTLRPCLDALLKQDYPAFEVIVADDGSIDGSQEILSGYGRKITVLTLSARGPSAARNTAMEHARGEFIAFTDSDCIVAPDWLHELVQCFTDESISAGGGIQKSPRDEAPFGRLVQRFLAEAGFLSDYARQKAGLYETVHNPSCNSIYRAAVLRRMGGFLPGLWPGEDIELDYRIRKAGGRIMFNSGAAVYHYRSKDLRGFCRMMFRYGRAQGFLVRRFGFFRPVQWLPFIFLILAIVAALMPVYGLLILAACSLVAAAWTRSFMFVILAICAAVHWNAGFCAGVMTAAMKRYHDVPGSDEGILLVNSLDERYGSTYRARRIRQALQHIGIRCTYVESNADFQTGTVSIRQANGARGFLAASFSRARLVWRSGIRTVMIQKMTPLTAASIIAARLRKRRLIIDWDDLDSEFQATSLRAAVTRLCEYFLPRLADTVTVHCPFLALEAKRRGARSVVYVPQAVDEDAFNPSLFDPGKARRELGLPDKTVLGLVSTCTEGGMRDIDVLLARAQHLLTCGDFYLLVVAGGPQERLVKDRLLRAVPAERFRLTGVVEQERVPLHIAATDACLVYMRDDPGNRARVSLKLLEYLAMKKPVFGSVTGFSMERLGQFVLPFDAVRPRNFASVCGRVDREAARAVVLRDFGIEAMATALSPLFL